MDSKTLGTTCPNSNADFLLFLIRNNKKYSIINQWIFLSSVHILKYTWYNNKRIHSTLGYITPNQKYNDYITNLAMA